MPSNREVRANVEDAVSAQLRLSDPEERLGEKRVDVLETVADEAFLRMVDEQRPVLEERDRELIQQSIEEQIAQLTMGRRFAKGERVVCRIGGGRGWAAGAVVMIDVDNPNDPTSQLPYVVKIDPPDSRMISAPRDKNEVVRAEVCFGQRERALQFTRYCLPLRQTNARRFQVGDRVTCAVEDASGDYSDWVAGKVTAVHHTVGGDAAAVDVSEAAAPRAVVPPPIPSTGAADAADGEEEGEEEESDEEVEEDEWEVEVQPMIVPYQVLLDSGSHVLVHRDEHWLMRHLKLQPPAPRTSADGTRNLKRMVKRKAADGAGWEFVDHVTGNVRAQGPADVDSDDED